jgi:hypothetical protein
MKPAKKPQTVLPKCAYTHDRFGVPLPDFIRRGAVPYWPMIQKVQKVR